MATIQIRDIPQQSYDVIRGRARTAGRSLQSYMRDVVIDLADRPTVEEVLAQVERTLAEHDTPGATRESVLGAIDADRR